MSGHTWIDGMLKSGRYEYREYCRVINPDSSGVEISYGEYYG